MKENFIRVLGSADWHQTAFNDHSCYTIDDRILIDACPSVVTQLLERGVDPLDVPVVCMTHMHCDHYMGLAPLMHYWRVCRMTDLSGLTIVGPKATVRRYVQSTLEFVFQHELAECVTRMPEIIELEGDCEIAAQGYRIRVTDSDHAVPGLCYRITDEATGHSVGLTGDTRYRDCFPQFFGGVDLLLHEASFGGGPVDPVENARCRHSSALEAVKICTEGRVKRLLLTHAYEPKREAALAAARAGLTIGADWAIPGNVYPF